MANIVIKELLSSDKVNEIVDKINFNFDQLLLNGGGPIGRTGGPGGTGPIGPRGTIWFTVNDLWTTVNSPTWSGTSTKANNNLLPGYPQYKGDPNRFLPIATFPAVSPWIYPENTFTFSIPTKPLRSGDLFLQESDDTFNSQSSYDGDIWEYNPTLSSWVLTGVNIKGDQGASGAAGATDWTRITSGSDDVLYPTTISGQDITRILIGKDSDIFDNDNSGSALIINTDLLHIALNHSDLHTGANKNDGATISVTDEGTLVLQGAIFGEDYKRNIVLDSSDNIYLQTAGPAYTLINNIQSPVPMTSIHSFTGGALEVNYPTSPAGKQYFKQVANPGVSTEHILTHTFDTSEFRININTSATGYGDNTANAPDIILQNNSGKNVGIGTYATGNRPKTKLQVNGSIALGSVSNHIGDNVYLDTLTNSYKPVYSTLSDAIAGWSLKQEAFTNPLSDQQLNLTVFPRTLSGVPFTGSNGPSYFTIKQNSVQDLGKVGINMRANILDSRLTINDTDGTGIHLIRHGSILSGGNTFSNSLTRGARIFHETSSNSYFDKRFNIIHYEANDFIIANKTDEYPTSDIHARIVIKKESGFIGINTVLPNAPFTLKGRGNADELLADEYTYVGGTVHPDEVNLGTFEDLYIEGLEINTSVNTGPYAHTQVNIQGGSYIGFNAWVENPDPLDPNSATVSFGNVFQQEGVAGAMILADKNGNLNFLNYEAVPQPFGPGPIQQIGPVQNKIDITSGALVETIKMTLTTDGRLGIGTLDPDRPLQVKGSMRSDHLVVIANATSFAAQVINTRTVSTINASDNNGLYCVGQFHKDSFPLFCSGNTGSGYNQIFFIRGNGTMVAPYRASIGYDAVDQAGMGVANALRVGAGVLATAFNIVSDARLKENIIYLDKTLDKLLKLKPLTYNLIDDVTKTKTIGFLAQEVAEVFPDIVSNIDDKKFETDTLSLNYTSFIMILVKSVQEQQVIINEQSDKIKTLENRLLEIEKILAKL